MATTTVAGVGTRVELLGQTFMLSGVFTDKATIEANSEIIIVGTEGDDVIFGNSSNEVIQGLAGNDELHGGDGEPGTVTKAPDRSSNEGETCGRHDVRG